MQKFLGRQEELTLVQKYLGQDGRHALMLYGRRRVGKSTLILQALSSVKCKVIYYECLLSSLNDNLRSLESKVCECVHNPYLHFKDFEELFHYLGTIKEKIVVVIDEYPYLKQLESPGYVDSLMQKIIDNLGSNLDIVILGSYIGMMKELLERDNPLFGRFDLVMHLRPFDYLDASLFYTNATIREKVEIYSVFGGSPFVNSKIQQDKSLRENICELIISPDSILRLYAEHVLLAELRKVSGANQILAVLANGKKRYGEIEQAIGGAGNGNLDKQLKSLLAMELVSKVYPINKRNDSRKCFYEISDNLVRFYYTYVYGKSDIIARIGAENFYEQYVKDSLLTFISHRFETLVREYFARVAKKKSGIRDIGTFWYDLPREKKSGEFDVVLALQNGYEFYEVKYYDRQLSQKDVAEIAEKIGHCCDFVDVKKIGVVSLEGFDFCSQKYSLITGAALYLVDTGQRTVDS